MIDIPFFTHVITGLSMQSAFGHDIVQMIIHAGLMVKFVLFVLFVFSVISWTIIFFKWRLVRKAKKQNAKFMEIYWGSRGLKRIYMESKSLESSPVANVFRAGYGEFSRMRRIQGSSESPDMGDLSWADGLTQSKNTIMDNLERTLKKSSMDQGNRLESALTFLATTGNTAPFIGLFGTVWGIMESFRGIGLKGSANLAVVAPGISEALIATAAGLAAAIPAVVAFNYFSNKIWELKGDMDIFASDFTSMVERQFFKEHIITNASN